MPSAVAPRMTAPRIILPIEHIDGEDVDERDILAIHTTECLNCTQLYTSYLPIIFARTQEGVIWWHRHHCNPNGSSL